MIGEIIIEHNLKSAYYDNLNSNIFGEQVRQLTESGCSIPEKYLNLYEKKFEKNWNKQTMIIILDDLLASVYVEERGYKWL